MLALVALLFFGSVASAQEVALTIEPPPGELVLTVAQHGDIRTHCPPACDIVLSAGALDVTLHRRRDPEVLHAADLHLRGASTLRAHRVDRSGERVAGWLVVGLVAIPGAALALTGLLWALATAGEPPAEAWALLAVGDVLFVGGMTVGLFFAFHFDEHGVELSPGSALGTGRD